MKQQMTGWLWVGTDQNTWRKGENHKKVFSRERIKAQIDTDRVKYLMSVYPNGELTLTTRRWDGRTWRRVSTEIRKPWRAK